MPDPASQLPPDLAGDRGETGPEQRLADLATRLLRTLGVARALAESGRQLDLRGIEDGVGRLCAQTLDLPASDAHRMVFRLREVLSQVDALSMILTRNGPAGPRRRQDC